TWKGFKAVKRRWNLSVPGSQMAQISDTQRGAAMEVEEASGVHGVSPLPMGTGREDRWGGGRPDPRYSVYGFVVSLEAGKSDRSTIYLDDMFPQSQAIGFGQRISAARQRTKSEDSGKPVSAKIDSPILAVK
ncbi:hypothetical protein THAOC_11081, partial [Thalassiosira oceanica]